MSQVDISGIDKAELLAGLYNRARPRGFGLLHYQAGDLPIEQARAMVHGALGLDFDYLDGRVMKVDLSGDTLRTDLYNRDNGENAAEQIVAQLRIKATA